MALIVWLSRSSLFNKPGAYVWLALALSIIAALPFELMPHDEIKRILPFISATGSPPLEEALKLLSLLTILCILPRRQPMILIGCALAIGVGFAGMETYSLAEEGEFLVALSRVDGFLYHSMYIGIAAGFIALAMTNGRHRFLYWLMAICIPTALHLSHNNLVFLFYTPPDGMKALMGPIEFVLMMNFFLMLMTLITIGIFVALFIKARSVNHDGSVISMMLLTIGLFGTATALRLFARSALLPESDFWFLRPVTMGVAALFALVGFFGLRGGWRRIS
ncbi:MAG: PrsW family glutamic-type intramembrane protease [Pseudomonadota bacterium]